jgi:YtkA-like
MKRINVALGVIVLSGVLAIGCGGGEQNNANTASGPAPGASSQPPAGEVEVTLTTQPDPPKMGETTFEAMVMMGGQPVTDADVSVELFMAAMPAMNMPEMRNSVALTHEGGGRYRGTGSVMMAGSWDATVSVKRNGQDVGARKVLLVAK